MKEARKEELTRQYLLGGLVTPEECSTLDLQELIFLVHAAKDHARPENVKSYLAAAHDKIRTAEALYMAFDQITNFPYIDPEERVWMFSKEEYAQLAQDHFLQQLIPLEMRKITRAENQIAFAELHRLGLKRILFDNGQYHMNVERDAVLPPMDWSGTPEINIPITNPDLQRAMMRFFQTLHSRRNYDGKQEHLGQLEALMIEEIIAGKYLVPMKLVENGESSAQGDQGLRTLEPGTTLQYACLESEDDTTWLPVFTDWIEFEKAYDKTEWNGNVATYADLVALSERMQGMVINCRGISFSINEHSKRQIEAYRQQKAAEPPNA